MVSRIELNTHCVILAHCKFKFSDEICKIHVLAPIEVKDYGWYEDTGHEFEIDDSILWDVDNFKNLDVLYYEIIRAGDTFRLNSTDHAEILEIYSVNNMEDIEI